MRGKGVSYEVIRWMGASKRKKHLCYEKTTGEMCLVHDNSFLFFGGQYFLFSDFCFLPLHDSASNLGSESLGLGSLMGNQETTSLVDRVADSLDIPRQDRTQVNQLDRQTGHLLLSNLDGVLENVQLSAPSNNRQVLALSQDLGLAQRQLIVANGDLLDCWLS